MAKLAIFRLIYSEFWKSSKKQINVLNKKKKYDAKHLNF